jgi:DNA ligase (NAD+)
VGRTGVLTPVAEFEPVQLGGSTVTRATLQNRDEITRLDFRLGDLVFVEKAGEIIPAITGVDLSRRTAESRPYVFPTACPVCRSALAAMNAGTALHCPNFACPAQVKRRIEHFASDAGVDIPGLGPALIDRLVDKGKLGNVADLYQLQRKDLLALGANVEKLTDRLLAAIERSKHAELWRFICGFGIPQVGEAAARGLARRFTGLDALARATGSDFTSVRGPGHYPINESAVRSVAAYFARRDNQKMVQALLAAGVRPAVAETTPAAGGPVAGKTFVLTGTLPNLTRAQATGKITAAGGTVASNVTGHTDYVVAGSGGGSKLEDARSFGVPVIDEGELFRLLADNGSH